MTKQPVKMATYSYKCCGTHKK